MKKKYHLIFGCGYYGRSIFRKIKKRNIIFIDENDNIYVLIDDNKVIYDSNHPYESPFIYYSQSHIIGIDIKQDLYPVMKGLCIIDDLSIYSQVAQAMFRLRKLNMGHKIEFIYIDKDETLELNNKKLYNLLKLSWYFIYN